MTKPLLQQIHVTSLSPLNVVVKLLMDALF